MRSQTPQEPVRGGGARTIHVNRMRCAYGFQGTRDLLVGDLGFRVFRNYREAVR
jgi:hypothetical protein